MIDTSLFENQFLDLAASMVQQIMDGRPPTETILRSESDYLQRWMLGRKITVPTFVASRTGIKARGKDDLTPFASELEQLYLHRYVRSDDEDMHCHPWPNATLLIAGWIRERRPDGSIVELIPGDVVLRMAEETHAIIECKPGTVTLFATGRKHREWGFHTPAGFIHHHDYQGKGQHV